MPDRLEKLKGFKYLELDEQGHRVEAAFGSGGLAMKTKIPKGLVMIWITMEPDGILQNATPVFRGFATRCDGVYVTSYHCVAPMRGTGGKVLVSAVGSDRCLAVDVDWEMTDAMRREVDLGDPKHLLDIAFISPRYTFTLLGVKNPKWGIFTPRAMTKVFTYDPLCKEFHMTWDAAEWNNSVGQEFYFYTHSNTHAGDSGMPVEQNGHYVGVHKAAVPQKYKNAHVAVPFLNMKEFIRSSERFTEITSGLDTSYDELLPQVDKIVNNPAEEEVKFKNESPDTKDFKRQEAEFAAAARDRMRGEHYDEQGYRKEKLSARPEGPKPLRDRPHKFKSATGANWADQEDEAVNEEPAWVLSGTVKRPAPPQTKEGAIEMLEGRLSRTNSVESLDTTTLTEVVKKESTALAASLAGTVSQKEVPVSKPSSTSNNKKKNKLQKLKEELKALKELQKSSEKSLDNSSSSTQDSKKTS